MERLGNHRAAREKETEKREEEKGEPATRRASPRRDSATCASSDGTGVCPTSPPRPAGVRQTSAIGKAKTEDAAIMIPSRGFFATP
jgi:hypothetical protein